MADARWQRSWGEEYIAVSKMGSTSAMTTARHFAQRARLCPGSRVLDVGAGHGRVTALMIEQVPQLTVTAVDLTWDLLHGFVVGAGANGCKLELAQVNLDDGSLPFLADSFDAAVSSRVFHYLADPVAALRDVARTLRPRGRAVITVPNRLNPIKYLTYRRARLYSPSEVAKWFARCGFEDIHAASMCFFPSTNRWHRLAALTEASARIPTLRLFGGSTLVWGTKPATPLHGPAS
jgi:ubiquinone/menaquinone biosynthesis C-methylase UbiE